ncbi:hypothetical protein D9M71_568570 [compost metagenome]
MAGATFIGEKTTVRATGLEGTRQPLLPVEQFVLVAHRIAKTYQLAHTTLFTQLRVATGVFNIGRRQLLDTVLEGHAPYCFPANVGNSVHLAWMECKAMAAIVDSEVQGLRVTFGILANAEAHHLWAVLTPRFEVGGFEPHVTDTNDVHVISPCYCSR